MNWNYSIAEDVALAEVKTLAEDFAIAEITDQEVAAKLPQVILAVRLGLLVIAGETITYTLKTPIIADSGAVALSEITVKTRMPYIEAKKIMKEADQVRDAVEYNLRMMGFMVGQPAAMVYKLSKFDYKVIEQLTSLFL